MDKKVFVKNYQVDWDKLTENEAQELLDMLCNSFSVVAKCHEVEGLRDVSYLETSGVYDDNFHGDKLNK